MALDRSRLTRDEIDELRVALEMRLAILEKRLARDTADPVWRDAKWRSFVVRSLTRDLDTP